MTTPSISTFDAASIDARIRQRIAAEPPALPMPTWHLPILAAFPRLYWRAVPVYDPGCSPDGEREALVAELRGEVGADGPWNLRLICRATASGDATATLEIECPRGVFCWAATRIEGAVFDGALVALVDRALDLATSWRPGLTRRERVALHG